jgi:hypothetical protein
MALGPGIYDDLATFCREQANADAVVLILPGGARGSGFSCQCAAQTVADARAIYAELAKTLRIVADQIERDLPSLRPPS